MSGERTKEELEAEYSEIEARRAARRKDREARIAAETANARLEEARRLDALEEALVKAEAEHGRRAIAVLHCRYPDGSLAGSLIVKRPHLPVFRRFQSAIADLTGPKRDEQIEQFWRQHLVWPDLPMAEAIVRETPATTMRLVDTIAELAGDHAKEVAGKS